MFFIPGVIISLLTFPGVIVHELAHQLFCRLARVAVLDVRYFRFGNPAGYVVHEPARRKGQAILIGIGPFFVNTIVGGLIALPASIPVLKFNQGSFLDYFLVWLGVSIAMHAFPSIGDAKSIKSAVFNDETPLSTKIIAVPIVGLIYVGALGSFIWLDVLYGIGVATMFSSLFVSILA